MADEAVRRADVAVAVNGGAEETKSASESSSFASFNRGGEGSAGLSPPQTWTDSSDGDDSRHSDEDERAGKTLVNERETSPDELFVLHVEVPNGRVKQSQLLNSTIISAQSIEVGGSLFSVLVGSAQSFFLSAALSSSRRQRLFARVRCNGGGTVACELLCDFSDVEAECRVTARLLHSAFSARRPFATPVAFCTRHAPNCALTHIDHVAIPYLGHLPTDLVGKSILSFVHAADLHVVVQAHVDLLASRGRVVRSASALRLVAHNGAILHATVEWSGFLNPWTRKLELVVARHQLCGAPIGDADVLAEPRTDGSRPLPLASASVVKRVENEIRQLLSTSVPSSTRVHKTVEQAAPTDLGAYIDRLVESLVTNTAAINANEQVNAMQSPEAMSAPSVLPLTYSQINCLENVHRLLKSQARAAETAGDLRESLPCREPPVLPLTRELLMQHTKKWEERYKDTWKKRLSQKRTVPEGSPIIAKRPRNDYNTMRPSPVPPPGQNFQITSVPLPPRPGSSEAPRPPPQPQAAWDASAENCAVRLLCLAARARAGFELLAAQQPLPQPPQPSVLPEVV